VLLNYLLTTLTIHRRPLFCGVTRARRDARDDSDYNVAVFLRSPPDRWAELDRLAALRVPLIDDTGAFLDAKPYPLTRIASV